MEATYTITETELINAFNRWITSARETPDEFQDYTKESVEVAAESMADYLLETLGLKEI